MASTSYGVIKAELAPPSTIYTVDVSGVDGSPIAYEWGWDISCGTFTPATPTDEMARWDHPNAEEGQAGTPGTCPHGEDPLVHEGTILVLVSNDEGYDSICRYEGAGEGETPCEAWDGSEPSPSPSGSPTTSPGVRCGITPSMGDVVGGPDEILVIDGTDGADSIEVRLRPGSDLEAEVVVDGEVLCTHFLDEFEAIDLWGRGGDDTLTVSEDITKLTILDGGSGKDTIRGGGGETTIYGGEGADGVTSGPADSKINGGGGEDNIESGEGSDSIKGGAGPDTIKPGAGANEVDGGKGEDTILDEIDEVIVIARAQGASDLNHDLFEGGGGNDRIVAGGSTDTVIGGPGNDHLRGGKHDDVLKGGDGRDDLDGQGGSDRLSGGADNDTLRGGSGSGDKCDGGSGKDRIFVGGDKGCESYS